MVCRPVPALVVVASIYGATSVAIDVSCSEDKAVARIDLDESSMLQQHISSVQLVQVSAEGTSEQLSLASNVLASVWTLVDALKENSDDVGNITREAADYASTVESEVIPNIEAAMAEVDSLLVSQRQFVEQCDVRLQVGETKRIGLHHIFLEKRSAHKACSAAESALADQVTKCFDSPNAREECDHLEAFHAAKAAECNSLRAHVDEAACAQSTHARGVCAAYGDCRMNSIAVYQSAANAAMKHARDNRAQLTQAKQAHCIALGLVTSAGDMKSMMMRLEECDALTPDSKDDARLELTNADVPPAMACQDAIIQSCSDDLVQLDLGSPVTWIVPCTSCLAMAMVTTTTATPDSWLSRFNSFVVSAKELAEASLDPRERSAMTVGLIGVSSKTTHTTKAQTASTAQYLVILIAVPLVALGIALGVAVACSSGRQISHARDGNMTPKMPGQRGPKEAPSPRLTEPRLSTRHSFASVRDRPSLGGSHLHGNPYGQDRYPAPSVGYPRQSLPPSIGPPVMENLHSAVPGGLCPELIVPEGSECILGIPSLSGAPRGEVVLKNITDKTGEALLYVGLTAAPAGGEYVLLAKQDQQELAFCELGNAVRSEGWLGKIFRWDGELYARLREEHPQDVGRRSMGIPGINRTFVMLSAVGPSWQLRITGNFRERKFCIEDGGQQVVAMASPGEELAFLQPAGEFYKLRLGPSADSCAVIVALLAMERLMCP